MVSKDWLLPPSLTVYNMNLSCHEGNGDAFCHCLNDPGHGTGYGGNIHSGLKQLKMHVMEAKYVGVAGWMRAGGSTLDVDQDVT